MLLQIFDDKRVVTAVIMMWTALSVITFLAILIADNSPFLSIGPNSRTELMGVTLDTWGKWTCVAVYTFISTCIAAFASDAVVPWITNTIQDHKTNYIPYSKSTCLLIIQAFTVYAVIISTIGMFVALTQIDFMLIRICADLLVNWYTTYAFLRNKITDPARYEAWLRQQDGGDSTHATTAATCTRPASSERCEQCAAEDSEQQEKIECIKLLVTAPKSDRFSEPGS